MSTTVATKNYVVVTASTLIRILNWTFKTKSLVPCILGPGGIGKSEIVGQLAAHYSGFANTIAMTPNQQGIYEIDKSIKLSKYMIDTRLGQLQVEDLTGMPVILHRISDPGQSVFQKGDVMAPEIFNREWYRCRLRGKTPPSSYMLSTYASPEFFPRDDQGNMTWFFDEINRADKPQRQTMFQITLDRKYFQYEMPDSVRLVLAGNWDPQIMYQVEELDPAFKTRIAIIYYGGPTYNEWKPVAINRGVHDGIVSFLGNHPTELITPPPSDEQGGTHANPRSWFKCSDLLKVADLKDSEAIMAAATAIVGRNAAAMLIQFLANSYEPLPDPSDLSKGLDFVKRCATRKETDKLTAFVSSVIDYINNGGEYTAKALKEFLHGIPEENSFSLLQALNSSEKGLAMATQIMGSDETNYDEAFFAKFAAAKGTV